MFLNPWLHDTDKKYGHMPSWTQFHLLLCLINNSLHLIKCTALYVTGVHLPALPGGAVTVRPCVVFDAIWRAFTVLAAQQRVIAESLTLTHVTGWFDCLRRADTASRHLVTQSAATLTRCRGDSSDFIKANRFQANWSLESLKLSHFNQDKQSFTHVCSRGSRSIPFHTLCTDDQWHDPYRDTVLQPDHMWLLLSQMCHSYKAELRHYRLLQESEPSLCRTVRRCWGWKSRRTEEDLSNTDVVLYSITTARGHHFQKTYTVYLLLSNCCRSNKMHVTDYK